MIYVSSNCVWLFQRLKLSQEAELLTSADSGPFQAMQSIQPHPPSAESSAEPSQPPAAVSTWELCQPSQMRARVSRPRHLHHRLRAWANSPSLLLCQLRAQASSSSPALTFLQAEKHPELALCPAQLQLASPQPEVSTPAGLMSVSIGGSGELLQLIAASKPPSVSAGALG